MYNYKYIFYIYVKFANTVIPSNISNRYVINNVYNLLNKHLMSILIMYIIYIYIYIYIQK